MLGDDSILLAIEAQSVIIESRGASTRNSDQKPTVFKRNEHYFLVSGAHSARSDPLLGPYHYKGAFCYAEHSGRCRLLTVY